MMLYLGMPMGQKNMTNLFYLRERNSNFPSNIFSLSRACQVAPSNRKSWWNDILGIMWGHFKKQFWNHPRSRAFLIQSLGYSRLRVSKFGNSQSTIFRPLTDWNLETARPWHDAMKCLTEAFGFFALLPRRLQDLLVKTFELYLMPLWCSHANGLFDLGESGSRDGLESKQKWSCLSVRRFFE